jgi:glycosyltransferase involved in cell wall biosynthesis
VPVVATSVSDNAQVAPDGRVGYIVPLGDEKGMADRICRLLEDTPLRQRMGQQARVWVEQEFSILRLAQKTQAVYAEALSLKHVKAGS